MWQCRVMELRVHLEMLQYCLLGQIADIFRIPLPRNSLKLVNCSLDGRILKAVCTLQERSDHLMAFQFPLEKLNAVIRCSDL